MRSRALAPLVLLLVVLNVFAAPAMAGGAVFAQEDVEQDGEGVIDEGDETEAENVGNQEGTEAETEVGTEEGQTELAEEEAGPIWTYQMVWLSIALVLLLGLGVARWYYMLVGRRQREGV